MSLRLLILFVVTLSAAFFSCWWMLSDTSDATFAEHPELWEGAGGATVGSNGPITVPPLNSDARPGISDVAALSDLSEKTWAEIISLLQREPDYIDGGDGDRRTALWYSAVTLASPDPKWRFPVAHLRLELHVGQGALIGSATVKTVSLLGTFGNCFASTDPSRINKPSAKP